MSVIAKEASSGPDGANVGRPPTGSGADGRRRAGRVAVAALALLIPVVVIGAVFIMPYVRGDTDVPFGFDTPHYQWRANEVIADGPRALETFPVPSLNPAADRPSFPVVASIVRAAGGPAPDLFVFVVPAVFAIAIGLAAGAFAREVLEEPSWAFGVYALATGASFAVVRTAVGSIDNLLVDSVVIAAMTTSIVAAAGRRGAVGAVALLGAAALIHWIFAAVALVLIGVLGLALIPESRRELADGMQLRRVPAGRIGVIVGAGLIAGLAGLGLTSSIDFTAPHVRPSAVSRKTARRIPALWLPVGVPLAAAGGLALWWPRSQVRRWGCILLVAWAASLAVGGLVYLARGSESIPLYRVAEFALAIPILGAAAIVAAARWACARGVPGTIAAVLLVAGVLAFGAWSAEGSWAGSHSLMTPQTVREVAAATAYLEALPRDRPIVFVANDDRFIATDRSIRAALPGDLVRRTRTFIGDASDLLHGRPSSTDPTSASALSWPGIEPILGERYVAVWLASTNLGYEAPPGSRAIAPGVRVVRGPAPSPSFVLPALVRPSAGDLVSGTAASLAVLLVAGLGWAACLADVSWLSRVGMAPAFGAAFLTLAGVAAGRVGWASSGGRGIVLLVAVGVGGWASAFLVHRAGASDVTV